MGIRVTHTLDDLVSDLEKIARTTRAKMVPIVQRNVTEGTRIAQTIAREASGPHGKFYFKRITGEMTGVLEGEFGPHGDVEQSIGGGWRHGANTDLPKAADVIGPKFALDAGNLLDDVFWPSS